MYRSRLTLLGVGEAKAMRGEPILKRERPDYRTRLTRPGEPLQTPFGISVLKLLCLFASLIALVDLAFIILGIHIPLHLSRYSATESNTGRAISDAISLSLFAPLLYTIHRRRREGWTLGWVVLVASSLGVLVSVLASVLSAGASDPDRWIEASVATIAMSIVSAYWLRWWNRQKRYFYQGGQNEAG